MPVGLEGVIHAVADSGATERGLQSAHVGDDARGVVEVEGRAVLAGQRHGVMPREEEAPAARFEPVAGPPGPAHRVSHGRDGV